MLRSDTGCCCFLSASFRGTAWLVSFAWCAHSTLSPRARNDGASIDGFCLGGDSYSKPPPAPLAWSAALTLTELQGKFTQYDLKRLHAYATNRLDYHATIDMIPTRMSPHTYNMRGLCVCVHKQVWAVFLLNKQPFFRGLSYGCADDCNLTLFFPAMPNKRMICVLLATAHQRSWLRLFCFCSGTTQI